MKILKATKAFALDADQANLSQYKVLTEKSGRN
jgi:hypothetical protein